MSPFVAWSFWNMTPFDTKLKAFTTSSWRITQSGWRSKVHLMLRITISRPPLVVITPNWCGGNCVAKASRNWRHKVRLVSQYNVSPTVMGQTPPKGLVWIRGKPLQGCMQFRVECDLVKHENKVGTIKGIHSLNLQGENNPKGVQKPSQKDHLPINAACIGMLTWKNRKKARGPDLVHSLWKKTSVMQWKLRWCQRKWVQEKWCKNASCLKVFPCTAKSWITK